MSHDPEREQSPPPPPPIGLRATHLLFAVHLCVFLVLSVADGSTWRLEAMQSLCVSGWAETAARPWTLVTYVFVHRDPLEFLAAAFVVLFLAGPAVEDRLGTRRFLAFYLGVGVLTALAHVALVEGGVAGGRLLSGSLGAAGALLTAYLFLEGGTRRVCNVPFPLFYLIAASALFALVAYVSYYEVAELQKLVQEKLGLAYRGEALSEADRLENLAYATLLEGVRPDMFTHLLGFGLGGPTLLLVETASRAQERYRVQREIRGLQEEVDARARVEQLLEKISRDGMGSLSRTERKFLRYASRFYQNGLPQNGLPRSPQGAS